MAKIKILSPAEICKIAAGEVVERPANIVKELVENALDAGATAIEIYITKSGKTAINIIDNGSGMSRQDAILCFAHHATSKISSVADLDQLNSFGFRGEALSSISAVSKVTLSTMEKGAACGTKVVLEDGKVVFQTDIAVPIGTDILITDLFYNVPARQKFLKKDDTEWRQILQLFQAFVFDYSEIHFKLYNDDRLVHNCPPVQTLTERVLQIWDAGIANSMLTINHDDQSKDLHITGIVSNHQTFRYNRANIFCYVNRRLIKNHGLVKALLKGYANILPEGRYPVAILFIELPHNQVDINVHPRKEEVSFLNPRIVENAISLAVKKALEGQLSKYIAGPKSFNQPANYQAYQVSNRFKAAQFSDYDLNLFDNKIKHFKEDSLELSALKIKEDLVEIDSSANTSNLSAQTSFAERNYEIIGQFKKTYILISNDDGLSLVDQHAAHERVMYERFKKRFLEVVTVNLMFPVIINLSPNDLETLRPHIEILRQHGIGAEVFGNDSIIIQSTPTYLKQTKLDDLVRQLIDWVQQYQNLDLDSFTKEINERMHAQMACKAAVKAGDKLTNEQMYELLDDLEKTENRLTCPHGRPTIWSFSLNEIEKKFKRKL